LELLVFLNAIFSMNFEWNIVIRILKFFTDMNNIESSTDSDCSNEVYNINNNNNRNNIVNNSSSIDSENRNYSINNSENNIISKVIIKRIS